MNQKVELLPEKIYRRDVFYDLYRRSSNVAVYALRYVPGGHIVGFDVFRVRVTRENRFVGDIMVECYPHNSDYGLTAWHFDNIKAATTKFEQLIVKA
jgi:hypothetical protein